MKVTVIGITVVILFVLGMWTCGAITERSNRIKYLQKENCLLEKLQDDVLIAERQVQSLAKKVEAIEHERYSEQHVSKLDNFHKDAVIWVPLH